MQAIIFGANGQDGFFLNKLLQDLSIETVLVSRSNAHVLGDVGDYDFVHRIINAHKPNFIFNFAASSSTSHEYLFENNRSISNGTINVLEAVRLTSPHTKVFLSGSAMQFKNEGKAINEETPFDASSHYAVARIHSVYTARYYREKFGLRSYVGYFFNHDSELRSEKHVNKKIISVLKQIFEGKATQLVIGNRQVRKEFNFAGDIVNAIWTFMAQEDIFELILGSGQAYSIDDWIRIVCSQIGLSYNDINIITDNTFRSEYDILVSAPDKLMALGWSPKVDIEGLAYRMINY